MKKIFFFFFILFIGIVLFVFLDMRYDQALSVREYKQSQEEIGDFKIIGKISDISLEDFSIVDLEFPEHSVAYEIHEDLSLEGFSVGDVVLIGTRDDQDSDFLRALSIEKIEDERTLSQIPVKEPLLSISILNYPENLSDICETAGFDLEITNLGDNPISHENLYDEHFGYTVLYRINDEEKAFLPIEDFDTIESGESKDVTFETYENTNSAMQVGKNLVGFDWAKRSIHEDNFTVINSSERVSIILENETCE